MTSISSESFSYQELLKEFESTRKVLGETEESLKRITGRDPTNFNNGPGGGPKWKNTMGGGPNMMKTFPGFAPKNKPLFPIVKRPGEEEEEEGLIRDSDDEEYRPSKRPSLASTVIAKPKDLKSRKESIKEQNVNSKVKARNRRMFGMILGTLQKFQHDAKKTQEQDQKRAEIEQKLEVAAAEERERVKKEKEELFSTRKEKQLKLRILERKIEIVEAHEQWEKNHKAMSNFILTKSEPKIYFLPAVPCAESKKKLEESKALHEKVFQERRSKMEQDLAEVEDWFKRDNFPGDKENIFPEDEEEEEGMDQTTQPEGGQQPQTEDNLEPEGPLPPEDTAENPEERTEEEKEERTEMEGVEESNQEDFEPIYD